MVANYDGLREGKTLVTGANGFVGSNLCQLLNTQNVPVCRVIRAGTDAESMDEHTHVIDELGPETDWSEALKGVSHVVHLAARVHVLQEKHSEPMTRFRFVNVDGAVHLAEQAAKAGVKRFVFVSSIGVHGYCTDGRSGYSEADTPNPQVHYTLSKYEAEIAIRKAVAETNMELVILRPPIIYGPRVVANFMSLLSVVDKGIPLPLGLVKNKRDMIYIGNFIDAITTSLQHEKAAGEVFVVADGQPVSTAWIIRNLAKYMHKPARLLPVPVWVLELAGKLTGKSSMVNRLIGSLEVNISHITKTLGWQPPYSMEEGLEQTVNWYMQHKSNN